jgi:hypothetical protein
MEGIILRKSLITYLIRKGINLKIIELMMLLTPPDFDEFNYRQ